MPSATILDRVAAGHRWRLGPFGSSPSVRPRRSEGPGNAAPKCTAIGTAASISTSRPVV